jgi:hypothetical protein
MGSTHAAPNRKKEAIAVNPILVVSITFLLFASAAEWLRAMDSPFAGPDNSTGKRLYLLIRFIW